MRFFLTELLRHAALMSLILAVSEWIWPTFAFAGEPGKRLYFIAFTSAWMSAVQLWFARPRARRDTA